MYYRIKFKIDPKQEDYLFELLQVERVKVRDVITKVRETFKMEKTKLVLLTDEDNSKQLDEIDYIEKGRTYIVKRLPPPPPLRRDYRIKRQRKRRKLIL